MPPIRSIVILSFVGVLMFFLMVNFIASTSIANNATVNPQIASYYTSLNLNSSSGVSVLSAEGVTLQSQLQNGNILASAGSAVTMVSSFFYLLPNTIYSFLTFIALGLAQMGIPTAYAMAATYGLMLVVMALGLISAIFIFGV